MLQTLLMANELYIRSEELLTAYLREHRMRCTQERLIILHYICGIGRHFTAESIVRDICEQEHISNATVYNNLALFCDANILRILPPRQQQRAEYEFTTGERHSLRFICTRCGREVDMKNKAIEVLLRDRHFSNFEMENFTLTVYGHCKTCRHKKKK